MPWQPHKTFLLSAISTSITGSWVNIYARIVTSYMKFSLFSASLKLSAIFIDGKGIFRMTRNMYSIGFYVLSFNGESPMGGGGGGHKHPQLLLGEGTLNLF